MQAVDHTRRLLVVSGFGIATALTPRGHAKKEEDEVPPTEDLMREHGVLRRVLGVYEEMIRRIERGQEVRGEWVRDSATIIREFIEDYHEKNEEEHVFPRLQKVGRLTDLVTVLLVQHQAGRRLTTDVLRLADQPAEATRRQLIGNLRAFVRMYEPHASREDTVLFPAFRALLKPRELEKLTDVFEQTEKALPHGGFEKMVDEVARIEQSLDIYDLAKRTPG